MNIIDVISPATACTADEFQQIQNFLQNHGLSSNIFLADKISLKQPASHEFPSFPAILRFEQLKQAIINPNSQMIWCARGGYGSAEILPFLYQMPKPQNKKIFIGFSDISSINRFLIEEWQWPVITAPLLAQITLNKVSEKSKNAILDLILGKITQLKYQLNQLTDGENKISAIVDGGCISVLSGNFATMNQINWQNKILFLEDEGEDGERLDRYFTQIITIIIEQKKYPAAILLGNFMEANPHGTPKATNIRIAINRLAEKIMQNDLRVPLFEEISGCLGHSKNMMPLVLGSEAVIEGRYLIQKI